MALATIADKDAIAARRQLDSCGLAKQHASWFRRTAPRGVAMQRSTIGTSTKFEAVASASTQSSRLQGAEPVMPVSLFLARIS